MRVLHLAPSKQAPPYFSQLNASSLIVNWDPPDYPNGVIIYYLVFRNDTLVFNSTVGSSKNFLLLSDASLLYN